MRRLVSNGKNGVERGEVRWADFGKPRGAAAGYPRPWWFNSILPKS
jgi:hypothetical protein